MAYVSKADFDKATSDLALKADSLSKGFMALAEQVKSFEKTLMKAEVFTVEDAGHISSAFSEVQKALASAITSLSSYGIGVSIEFDSMKGSLVVQLFKYEVTKVDVKAP